MAITMFGWTADCSAYVKCSANTSHAKADGSRKRMTYRIDVQ
jgi:hypothetical protein